MRECRKGRHSPEGSRQKARGSKQTNDSVSQSLNQPITDDSMSQSSDRPITQSPDQSIPQSLRQPKELTRFQRLEIRVLGWVGHWIVKLIGGSLRWEVYGWENWQAGETLGKRLVYTFWHREIFAATWFWRKRGIVVMSGHNFDARSTAEVIQRHGYEIARGSASRGAARALVGMVRAIQRGHDAAFTIDGPRGPRYVAKPGAVMLAKASGAPILCFHIRPERSWTFSRSWDATEIPRPFSRAAIFIAPPIVVARNASDAEQAAKLREVQATLDGLVREGNEWAEKSGDRAIE
jgi:lysophospholipid acyltransferase (LPLAT)-like uncharacterized protein